MTKQTTTKPAGVTTKPAAEKAAAKPRETKIGKIIALLKRKDGTTLDEVVEATSWLPHTTRAALTSLKKKGHTVERDKRGDKACYRITRSA